MSQTLLPSPARAPRASTGDTPPASAQTIRIMGVDFAALREADVVAAFVDRAVAGDGRWVVTANLDHLRRFASEPRTRELIQEADVVVADGAPIVLASRIAGMALPERVAGSSMLVPICRRAAAGGASVFLLGGEPGVAERARVVLEAAAPGLRVAGTHCPPYGFEHDEAQLAEIERALLAARPDIVLVALSFPKTDALIARVRPLLSHASFMGIGIALSYVIGDERRAPAWMRDAGIEWLHRLVHEPRRLWRRYLVRGLPFAGRLAAAAAVARVQRRLGGPWFAHAPSDAPTFGTPKL